jgi:membrane associated rhomboid family serine protease
MASQSGATQPTPAPRRAAEIDLDEARKAFFLMVGFIGLIWALQIANWADHYNLDQHYGIIPHDLGRLPDIFVAPFLHFSWDHIEGNSGPLFIFGLLAAYRGVVRFLGVTLVVAITSGMAVWLFQSDHTLSVGASGRGSSAPGAGSGSARPNRRVDRADLDQAVAAPARWRSR